MQRFCFVLDLKNQPELIAQYVEYHRAVWPEILESIRSVGVLDMEIFHLADRLFMIMETVDDFSLQAKAKSDTCNPRVQEWENLMSRFQKPLTIAPFGTKWMLMDCIFDLTKSAGKPG